MIAQNWFQLDPDESTDPVRDRVIRLLTEHTSQALALINADGYCLYANPAFRELTGFSLEELLAQPIHDLIHHHYPDGSFFPREECLLHDLFAQEKMTMQDAEFHFFRKDGTPFTACCSANRITRNGKTICVAVEMHDVTMSKQEDDYLQRKEFAYRFAVAAAKIGTWEQNFSDNSIAISAVTAQILGFTPTDATLPEALWHSMIFPDDLPMIQKMRKAAPSDGKPFDFEFRLIRQDGHLIWIASRGVVVTNEEGKPIKATGVMLDITHRKKADQALRESEERFRLLAELSPDAILVYVDDRFVYANPSAVRILGAADSSDIIGRRPLDFIDPDLHELVRYRQAAVLKHQEKAPMLEMSWRTLDGKLLPVQATAGRVTWNGKVAIQLLLRDTSEQQKTRNQLKVMGERLKLAVEGLGEGIWDWDIPNKTFTFSGGLRKILGRPEHEQEGKESEWQQAIHPDDLFRVLTTFEDAVAERTPAYQCEYRIRAKDGSWKWVRARGIIVERDQEHRPLMMTGTMTDITARKEADELTWRHANVDALTGLPNRRLFRERLELEIRKSNRSSHPLALLFIDLDGFKQVNDLYGHDAGDALLKEAADRIKSAVRATDTVARLGGDEFTVILSELDNLDHVEFVCQKIIGCLSEGFPVHNETAYISGSIGVSLFPLDGNTSDDMLRKADQAMYAAKKAGKNQFSYFTREMDEKAHMRLRLSNELRHALKKNQLSVHFQPVVDLQDGHIVKAEALLRWHHPRLGEVEPAVFIPIAEESGLIRHIGNWVFREAAQCSKLCSKQADAPFQVSVNQSPSQFMSRESDPGWLHYLLEHGVPVSSISIEITEGVLLQESHNVSAKLLAYHDAGVQIALDDFGTGFSSMSYLQKFQIDYVKIDQSFVFDMDTNPNSRTIAETIIIMAHKLGKKVIAEGIETPAQLKCLTEAGCDYGQGYLFSPAVPAAELQQLLGRPVFSQARLMH